MKSASMGVFVKLIDWTHALSNLVRRACYESICSVMRLFWFTARGRSHKSLHLFQMAESENEISPSVCENKITVKSHLAHVKLTFLYCFIGIFHVYCESYCSNTNTASTSLFVALLCRLSDSWRVLEMRYFPQHFRRIMWIKSHSLGKIECMTKNCKQVK